MRGHRALGMVYPIFGELAHKVPHFLKKDELLVFRYFLQNKNLESYEFSVAVL